MTDTFTLAEEKEIRNISTQGYRNSGKGYKKDNKNLKKFKNKNKSKGLISKM